MKIWIVSTPTDGRPLIKVFDNAEEAWKRYEMQSREDPTYMDEDVVYSICGEEDEDCGEEDEE